MLQSPTEGVLLPEGKSEGQVLSNGAEAITPRRPYSCPHSSEAEETCGETHYTSYVMYFNFFKKAE